MDLDVHIAEMILINPTVIGMGWGIASSMSRRDDPTLTMRLYMVEAIWITCHAAKMLMNTGEMLEMWVDEMQSAENENKQSLTV